MPSRNEVRAWVAVSKEEWAAFKGRAAVAGIPPAELVARLVRHELRAAGVQLELETPKRRRRPSSAPQKATRAAQSPPKRRRARKLPVVSEKELRTADARGKAAAKRTPVRKAGKERPTRRRSS